MGISVLVEKPRLVSELAMRARVLKSQHERVSGGLICGIRFEVGYLSHSPTDPFSEEHIKKEILALISIDDGLCLQGLEHLLHGRRRSETVLRRTASEFSAVTLLSRNAKTHNGQLAPQTGSVASRFTAGRRQYSDWLV